MTSVTHGALDGLGAFAYYIQNQPWFDLDVNNRTIDRMPFGEPTLHESIILPDGSMGGIKPPPGPKEPLLLPGVSILEISPITMDEAIGLCLVVCDDDPGVPEWESHLLFSEVSVEFLDGPVPYLRAPMDMDAGLEDYMNTWRLPSCGIWRVRGYGDYDFEAAGDVPGWHPDSVSVLDYLDSGRTPESLPCQIRLEMWPEPTLRDAIHKTEHTDGKLVTVACTEYHIGGTPEDATKRNAAIRKP